MMSDLRLLKKNISKGESKNLNKVFKLTALNAIKSVVVGKVSSFMVISSVLESFEFLTWT